MQALNVLEVATALRHVWRAVRVDGATKTITHMRAMNDDEKMDLVREHVDLLRRSGAHTPTMNEVGLYLFILFYLFIYFFGARRSWLLFIYLFIYLFWRTQAVLLRAMDKCTNWEVWEGNFYREIDTRASWESIVASAQPLFSCASTPEHETRLVYSKSCGELCHWLGYLLTSLSATHSLMLDGSPVTAMYKYRGMVTRSAFSNAFIDTRRGDERMVNTLCSLHTGFHEFMVFQLGSGRRVMVDLAAAQFDPSASVVVREIGADRDVQFSWGTLRLMQATEHTAAQYLATFRGQQLKMCVRSAGLAYEGWPAQQAVRDVLLGM